MTSSRTFHEMARQHPRARAATLRAAERSPGRLAAFASDLDRTLIRPGAGPTSSARAALREARALGLRNLLVSGRSYLELSHYARQLGELDGIVAENGAIVEAPIGSRPTVIGRSLMAAARRRLRTRPDLDRVFHDVTVSVARSEAIQLTRLLKGLPVRILPNVDWLDVGPPGVSKATGTHLALVRLGLPRGAYAAIGDGENDVELLRGARLAGAVANATPAVRAVADYVCRARYSRGVLEFVRGPVTRGV